MKINALAENFMLKQKYESYAALLRDLFTVVFMPMLSDGRGCIVCIQIPHFIAPLPGMI